jgi:hypothetical protein
VLDEDSQEAVADRLRGDPFPNVSRDFVQAFGARRDSEFTLSLRHPSTIIRP